MSRIPGTPDGVPGFIPTPLGEIVEYLPSPYEILVTLGIWATGLFIITCLIKHAVDIETGVVRLEK